MKGPSESKTGDYVQTLIERNSALNRAVNRHFQGIITAVDAPDGNWPFIVNIERTEGPDGMDWICAIPGYVPLIGDNVECEWRDEDTGYIKYPLTHHKFIAIVAQVTGQALGSVTVINYDTIISDVYKCFDAGLTKFTCPYNGFYRCSGAFRVPAAAELEMIFNQNGSNTKIPFLSGLNSAFAVGGTASLMCLAGDTLQAIANLPQGGQTSTAGIIENWFEVEYMGPL